MKLKGAKDHQSENSAAGEGAGRPRRSRARHVTVWSIRGFLLLVLIAVFAGLLALGQGIHAPPWLRDRVEMRIERGLNGMQLEFGAVDFVINEGWRPRLRLTDVTLTGADGSLIARVADAQASLAMRPLLRGRVYPKRISLSGLFMSLRRDASGQFSVALGDAAAPVQQAPSMNELIGAFDAVLLQPQLSALTAVNLDAVTMGYEDARSGRAWTLDGGHIAVSLDGDQIRLATGFSLLGGRDYVSAVEANYERQIGSSVAEFGISISDLATQDIASQAPALGWLSALRAPISGALRGGTDDAGQLTPLSATFKIGEGVLQPTPQTRPVPFKEAQTYFTYDPQAQLLTFDEVSIDSAWGAAVAEGTAHLEGVETGVLEQLEAQFQLTGLRVNPRDAFREPLELDAAGLDFQLALEPFHLRLGQMYVQHDNRTVRMRGDLMAAPEGWDLALDADLDQITPQKILEYWPETIADKPRDWVRKNLIRAQISDVEFALRAKPGQRSALHAGLQFSRSAIRFAKTLPPLVDASGYASLDGRRFAVTARQGWVVADSGDVINAAGSSFIIPDISIKKAAPGVARIQARGPVTAGLSLLDRPPLNVMSKARLPVDLASGQVALAGTLSLPLKKKVHLSEMRFHYTGELRDVASAVLVPDHTVSAQRLTLTGDQTHVQLAGPGRFGDVPLTAIWRQPIGKGVSSRSRLSGQIELSRGLLDEVNAGLPPSMVSGTGQADIVLEVGGGIPPALEVRSDLAGVVLALPDLGWRKPAAQTGRFQMTAQPTRGGGIEDLQIEAAGLSARGDISFSQDQQFERARFSSFRLGDWISAPVELVGRGDNPPAIRVTGGQVDMRAAPKDDGGGNSGGTGTGPDLTIALDRLQITDSLALTGFRGQFSGGAGLNGNFQGAVNGGTAINGQVLRRQQGSGFFLQSSDAGGVLRSARLLNQARGGEFQLSLEPLGPQGHFDGRLKIKNTRIKDAPAMAALLNAISVVGLLDEMSGAGIQFSEIDGRFRLSPTEITILQGSAVGPSIGLSVDGRIDTRNQYMSLQGVVSPVYLLNAIGSILTRKGEGVIGFNYTLTGPVGAPSVGVNPLSALTPAFLRDIFRTTPRTRGQIPQPAQPAPAATIPEPPVKTPEDTGSKIKPLPGENR